MAKLNHPDPVYGYRLDYAGASIVYATDNTSTACVDPNRPGCALAPTC